MAASTTSASTARSTSQDATRHLAARQRGWRGRNNTTTRHRGGTSHRARRVFYCPHCSTALPQPRTASGDSVCARWHRRYHRPPAGAKNECSPRPARGGGKPRRCRWRSRCSQRRRRLTRWLHVVAWRQRLSHHPARLCQAGVRSTNRFRADRDSSLITVCAGGASRCACANNESAAGAGQGAARAPELCLHRQRYGQPCRW